MSVATAAAVAEVVRRCDHAVVRAADRARGGPARRRRSRVGAPGPRRDAPAALRSADVRAVRRRALGRRAARRPALARLRARRGARHRGAARPAPRRTPAGCPPAEADAARRVDPPPRRRPRSGADPTCSTTLRAAALRARLARELAAAAAHPVYTARGVAPASEALRPVVHSRWKKLRRAVRKLGDNPSGRGAARGAGARQAVPVRRRGVRARVRQARAPARRAMAQRAGRARRAPRRGRRERVARQDRARVLAGARRTRSACSRRSNATPPTAARAEFPARVATRRHQARPRLAVSTRPKRPSCRPRAASSTRTDGRRNARVPRRAPAPLRRLEPAQGQARAGRVARGGGPPRGRGGDGRARSSWAPRSRPPSTSTATAGPRSFITGG